MLKIPHSATVPPVGRNLKSLKATLAWGQLTIEEKRFLKHNLNVPKYAHRVELILTRAQQKADVVEKLRKTPATAPPSPSMFSPPPPDAPVDGPGKPRH